MMFSFTTSTTLAASSSKTVTSKDTMSPSLTKQASGDSNVAIFDFSVLPFDAIVIKVVVDANSGITYGHLFQTVFISEHLCSAPWCSLNKTEITTGVNGKLANGTWSIYYNGANVST